MKVFDMESCQRRLSGGYVTLLFSVATSTDAGRELLSNAGVWSHLASMGNQVRNVSDTIYRFLPNVKLSIRQSTGRRRSLRSDERPIVNVRYEYTESNAFQTRRDFRNTRDHG